MIRANRWKLRLCARIVLLANLRVASRIGTLILQTQFVLNLAHDNVYGRIASLKLFSDFLCNCLHDIRGNGNKEPILLIESWVIEPPVG